jgi:aspartate-semialdehyde dehydrogenase
MNVAASVAVVGATGAVGKMMAKVLEERNFPISTIKFLASEKSAGKALTFRGKTYTVEATTGEAFSGVQIVLSSTPAGESKLYSPQAVAKGAIVIDNSSAYRMDPECPLVVPEVNADTLSNLPKGIIANPNCSTIQMMVALKPLHDLGRIKRIVVSTYQASSGKGAEAVEELKSQLVAVGRGEEVPSVKVHAAQLAGNCITLDWSLDENDYTEEENKVIKETRKILGDESILVSPTCVRVPVDTGHSESINVEFYRPVSVEEAKAALAKAPGVILMDSKSAATTPQPILATGRDETFVGRVRKDPSNPNALNLWVVADNLRKGAASNAVQIAEELLRRGMIK